MFVSKYIDLGKPGGGYVCSGNQLNNGHHLHVCIYVGERVRESRGIGVMV